MTHEPVPEFAPTGCGGEPTLPAGADKEGGSRMRAGGR